jgi:Flp pilus assembly protein TadG
MKRARARDERGSTTVEFVVLVPLMVLLLMVVVQFGIYFHTRAVATTAAHQAADNARILDGTAEAGSAAATQFLDQNAGALRDQDVSVERSDTDVTVTVTGEVLSLIPFASFPLDVTVSAPVERIVE